LKKILFAVSLLPSSAFIAPQGAVAQGEMLWAPTVVLPDPTFVAKYAIIAIYSTLYGAIPASLVVVGQLIFHGRYNKALAISTWGLGALAALIYQCYNDQGTKDVVPPVEPPPANVVPPPPQADVEPPVPPIPPVEPPQADVEPPVRPPSVEELLQEGRQLKDEGKLELAVDRFRQAAEQNNPSGQLSYGIHLLEGRGVAKNEQEGVHYIQLAADQGVPRAQWFYGEYLLKGDVVPQDVERAARCFKQSADQGLASAQLSYGKCLLNGVGVPKNEQEGRLSLERAAAQGLADAQLAYGQCLLNGTGGPRNVNEGMIFLRRAAAQGLLNAQLLCVEYLIKGTVVPQNQAEGLSFLELAIKQISASMQLLRTQFRPDEEMPPDLELKLAEINQYLVDGRLSYARSLLNGTRVAKNEREGVRLIKQCADQGSVEARLLYAQSLLNGTGVAKNTKEGVRLIKQCADQGSAEAQCIYAEYSCAGSNTVPKNVNTAIDYFRRAAAQGHSQAQQRLQSFGKKSRKGRKS
jgi:TPR repeat protein